MMLSRLRKSSVIYTISRCTSTGHKECREKPRNPYYDPHHEESIWGSSPRCFVGRKSHVTMAAGVGVGPELMDIVKSVFLCANAPVVFEELPMGADAEDVDMDNLIYSVERNGSAIKGNIEKKLEPIELSRNMILRRALDLYVNLIEIKTYPGLADKIKLKSEVDLVLVRQNTEGEFAMLEHDHGNGIENLKITTEYNTRRLAEFAFDYAVEHNRRKVTAVYSKGVMRWGEGLFLDTVAEVARRHPMMPFKTQSMSSFASNMSKPRFNGDVVITGSLYGGIILSLLFGFMRGTGLICGQNLGRRYAVFEPAARNKGYKLAGKNLVNPVAALMCGVKLLRHLGHDTTADRIEWAIDLTMNEDMVHTRDVLGTATTSDVVRNIQRRIREIMPEGYRDETPPQLPPTPPPTQPFQSLINPALLN